MEMSHHHKHKNHPHDESDKPAADAPPPLPPEPATEAPKDPLAAIQAERDDLLGRLQRVSADYVNYQKRVQRDLAQAREYANEDILKAMLGVLDDLERAIDAARQNHSADDPLLVGTALVQKKAMETLGRFGLTRIQAEGKPFDPELHSALMQQPSDQHPPRTVLKELQAGYRLKDRTLRPAQVIVSKEPEAPAEEKPNS